MNSIPPYKIIFFGFLLFSFILCNSSSIFTGGLRIVSSKADGCINYISYHQDINYFSKNKRIIKILADHTDVKEPFEFFRLFIDNTNLQRYYTSEGLKHYSFIDNIVD